jgi:hypothetical protein
MFERTLDLCAFAIELLEKFRQIHGNGFRSGKEDILGYFGFYRFEFVRQVFQFNPQSTTANWLWYKLSPYSANGQYSFTCNFIRLLLYELCFSVI